MFSSAVPSWPGASVTMGASLSSCAPPQSPSVTLCPSRDPRKTSCPSRLNQALYLNFTFIWPMSQTCLALFLLRPPHAPFYLSWPAAHFRLISVGRCLSVPFPPSPLLLWETQTGKLSSVFTPFFCTGSSLIPEPFPSYWLHISF